MVNPDAQKIEQNRKKNGPHKSVFVTAFNKDPLYECGRDLSGPLIHPHTTEESQLVN